MYVIDLALKLCPIPFSVHRKELASAELLFKEVLQSMESSQPKLLQLTCEQTEDKKIAILSSEILAVQMYEKSSALGGSKRPGFSFQS